MMYAYSIIFTSFELLIPYGLVIFILCFYILLVREYRDVYTQAKDYAARYAQLEHMLKLDGYNQSKRQKLLSVNCMGEFKVTTITGESINFRTKKSKELMAFLIHNYNSKISSERIIAELWPDKTADKAKGLLYTTIYYLKKSLNTAEHTFIDKSYIIKEEDFFADYKQISNSLELLNREYLLGSIGTFDIDIFERISKMYVGEYMENEAYGWAISRKLYLNKKFVNAAYIALDYYNEKGKHNKTS